jgi:aspartate aminotransferase-like enzyme
MSFKEYLENSTNEGLKRYIEFKTRNVRIDLKSMKNAGLNAYRSATIDTVTIVIKDSNDEAKFTTWAIDNMFDKEQIKDFIEGAFEQ